MNDLYQRWKSLDTLISQWWDEDTRRATEPEILDPRVNRVWIPEGGEKERNQEEKTLLFLPFPYISGAGSEAAFPEMYCWDVFFVNSGLLLHNRHDIVRNHLLNHLFSILRFGMVLNGNRSYYLTRSQTPLLAQDVWRYYSHTDDLDFLSLAYPLLKQQFLGYWDADHHRTPTGLATCRDLGDPTHRPELAAEAEVLDFTPLFGGDVRRCVPLQINCALVAYLRALARMARALKRADETARWEEEAEQRSRQIRKLCWNPSESFFFEYDFVAQTQIPVFSLCAYWTLWAEVATPDQAEALVTHLQRFAFPHGLAFTDRIYPSPHHEFEWLQWQYPAGWPPMQMMVTDALLNYGYTAEARRHARAFLSLVLEQYAITGKLWEKYNVVEGNLSFPTERYSVPPMHGWASAAVTTLGHLAFSD